MGALGLRLLPTFVTRQGLGSPQDVARSLSDDAITAERSAVAANFLGCVCALPPPLTNQPVGATATWSAPSIARMEALECLQGTHVQSALARYAPCLGEIAA